MTEALIGIDVGTTGVKAVAISPDGELLGVAEEGYPLSTPRPGWSEQDPEDWFRASQAALARLPEGPVGFSGQMHGLVVLGADDRVLRPAILWNDQRTGAECAEIEERIGLERLIALTGNRALPGFTAPKLVWLQRNEPETWDAIRHVLLPKDYVRFRMTGERVIDVADASGTLLLDVEGRRWSDEVCSALEIPAAWLPEVHESTVVAGAGDQAAGALGVGIDRPGPLSVVLGTSGVVFAVLPVVLGRRRGAAPRLLPRRAGNVACDGRDALGCRLARMAPRRSRRRLPRRSTRRRRAGSPAPKGSCSRRISRESGRRTSTPTFGARSPASPSATTAGRSTRAVLEGVAYGLRDSLELLRELGVEAAVGRVSGGGSRSDLWLKIVASVLGIPLERVGSDAGAAFGAALLAACRAEVFSDPADAVARCVRTGDRIDPDPAWVAAYDEGYERFKSLYPALRPLEGA